MLFPDLPEIDGVVEHPTAADYAVAARFALERKRLPRAVEQIAAALAIDPLHEEHLRVLGSILDASRSPLELVRIGEEGTFFGLIAVRARVLARERRFAEALETLTEAVVFRPGTPYLEWIRPWLDDSHVLRRVKPEVVATLLIRLSDVARNTSNASETSRNLRAALDLAARIAALHPAHSELAAARSRMLRLLGEQAEAERVLSPMSAGGSPSWAVAIERAALARDRGRADERIEWLERAREARPEDQATLVDLGDALLRDGAAREAEAAYERALGVAPSAHAQVARDYVRWLADGSLALLHDDAARSDPELSRFREDALGYDGILLDPVDPLVRIMRGVLHHASTLPEGQRVRVRVSADRPLAPSAQLAFQYGLAALGRSGELEVELEAQQAWPNLLWERVGTAFVSRHSAPAPALSERFGSAACAPFSWQTFRHAAAELAQIVSAASELMSIVTRPPAVPSGVDAVEWVGRVQLLAGLAIAAHAAPWAERAELLHTLMHADDWVSIAGVLGLVAAAETNPTLRPAAVRDLSALVPSDSEPLPVHARALAIGGLRLVEREAGSAFFRLRMRALVDGDRH